MSTSPGGQLTPGYKNGLHLCPRQGCGGQVLYDLDWHCLQCGVRNVRHESFEEWHYRVLILN